MTDFDWLISPTPDYSVPGLPTPQRTVFKWATVTQSDPLRIVLDGDTVALPFTPDSLVIGARVGARVWVQLYGKYMLVLGTAQVGQSGYAPTSLGVNVDLDSLLNPGGYVQPLNASTSSAFHYPVNYAGWLEVAHSVSEGFIWQRYTTYPAGGLPPEVYIRARYATNGWSAWRPLGGKTGSSSNGKWSAESSGTQTCRHSMAVTPSSANTPKLFYWTFPRSFAETPHCQISVSTSVPGTSVTGWAIEGSSATQARGWITRGNTITTTVSLLAIGKGI